jgi:uncharacterized membrane protein YkoI
MPVPRILLSALLLGLLAGPSFAADAAPRFCLSKAEQRAAVADHKAIKLAQAVKSLREHGRRAELVRAQLCHRDDRLVYVLTLLARSGKVTSATVDAANGDILNGR